MFQLLLILRTALCQSFAVSLSFLFFLLPCRQRYTDKPSCDDAGTFYCVVAVVAVVFRAQRGEIGPHSAAGDAAAAVVVGCGNTSKLVNQQDVSPVSCLI